MDNTYIKAEMKNDRLHLSVNGNSFTLLSMAAYIANNIICDLPEKDQEKARAMYLSLLNDTLHLVQKEKKCI